MATFYQVIQSVLQTLRGYKRPQTEIMLSLLKDNKDGVKTDVFKEHGIRDHRSVKYKLSMRGYIIHTIQPHKERFVCDEGTYVLVGRICPPLRDKRGYMKDFTTEEIRSELFKRDKMGTIQVNGEIYDIIKR